MKKYLILILTFSFYLIQAQECKLVHRQCYDNAPTKKVGDYTFSLAQYCAQNGLQGDACCWNSTSDYYCSDTADTCQSYRKNPNCVFEKNTCIQTDPLSGACLKAQATFSCASQYTTAEKQICTTAVCVNNNNDNPTDTANNCFMPTNIDSIKGNATSKNIQNIGIALSYLEVGKQASTDLQNCQNGDPQQCTIFRGNYYTCDIFNPNFNWNNGSDCMLHTAYFNKNMAGQNSSDKAMYGSVASNQTDSDGGFQTNGNNYKIGDRYSYGLSNQDQQTMNSINYEVQTLQGNNSKLYNSDTNAGFNSNGSSRYMSLRNSQISSVTMNNYASDHIGQWDQYLTAGSATLAWNRMKADPDPFNPKRTTLSEIGITNPIPNNVSHWGDAHDKPAYAEGLCLHLSNYNDGGNDADTGSIAGQTVCAVTAAFNAVNCGAVCTNRDPITGICITASPRPTRQEWCCFNSKIAEDITIAAWDQGITNPYRANEKFINGGDVTHDGGKCGGITVAQLSKIDFSKANYFKDFQNSIVPENLANIANMNSVTGQAQGAIQGRVNNGMNSDIQKAKQ
jgi:hypothetical protein